MSSLARIIIRNSWLVLLITATITVFAVSRIVDFASGEVRLRLDPSLDRLVPEGDEERVFYERTRMLFGSDETLLVALIADDVFQPDVLESVVRLTRRLEAVDGVHHVVSLASALNIRAEGEDLEIEPFLTKVPSDPRELARIRREALENPIYSGNLVAADGGATALLVYFLDMSESEFRERGLDATVAQLAQEESGAAEVRITGPPHIKNATSNQLLADLRRTLPLAVAIVCVVALISFRTVRGVLVPLSTVLIALVWTFGVIAWLGRGLNIVTTIVPPLILTLGFAYAVHVISAYYEAAQGSSPEDRSPAEAALLHVSLPVVLTGLTTVVGFLSLMVSPMGAIREFGLFSVIGIVATLVVALTYTPAMLNVLSVPKRWAESAARESWIDRAAEALARFDLDHRSAILAGGVLIAGLAIWGASRLELSSDMIGNFPPDHHVRRDFGAVNESLQGANPFYVVIETDYSDAFTEPANLHEIARLQRWLEEQPEIGGTTSLVDYLRLINRGFNGGDPAYLVIPDDEALIAQLLLFGANDEIKNFVDTPYQRANILVRSKVIDSGKMGILLARIQTRLAELPERLHPRITGNSVLLSRTTDDIARGQVESLSAAFIGIYAILVLLFMSFRIGLIALIPNALPVLGFFGLMGWSGVTLNATTSLIACIVLGIAVDDSIHYLARFNQDSKSLASEHEGTIAALRSVARPVTVTTIGVCLGFLTLTLSELKNQIEFGALSAATLAFAWLIDVTLTPALCSRLRIVSLWDVLSLDLGRDPQLSIPLFRGLSRAQARVVALVSSVRSFPSGERIMSAGEPGDEMYVVIDGELEASVVNEDGRVELGEFGRGDLLGDVAMFHGKRTADVDTTSDVRLLRLTGASLERLARRYPRIAVKVNRNLADVLAERLVKLTERVRN